ncbi:hypothetical protein NL676_026994 [Syzygium grande]|nr:hypothetical protein NL676_026994 [Syzygium grande]
MESSPWEDSSMAVLRMGMTALLMLCQFVPELKDFIPLVCMSPLRRSSGMKMFKGYTKETGASVIRVVPYAALQYTTYEQYRGWILDNCPSFGTGPFIDLLAGSASGGTAVFCTYPLDLARTKLAYQVMGSYSSENPHSRSRHQRLRDIFRDVYQEGGVRAFYRGIGPTLVGILPYAGLKYYIYEELKLKIPEDHHDSIAMRLSLWRFGGVVRADIHVSVGRREATNAANSDIDNNQSDKMLNV